MILSLVSAYVVVVFFLSSFLVPLSRAVPPTTIVRIESSTLGLAADMTPVTGLPSCADLIGTFVEDGQTAECFYQAVIDPVLNTSPGTVSTIVEMVEVETR